MKKKLLYVLVILFIVFVGIFNCFILFGGNDGNYISLPDINSILNVFNIESDENNVLQLKDKYNNSDIVGTISILNDPNFYYPVAQSSDNKFYLNHDYYKNKDGYGAIYADYRVNLDNSRKVLIFGHSSSKITVPFNELENYEDYNYYNNHKDIKIETENGDYIYTIFSVFIETNDFTYMNINFDNDQKWYSHLSLLKQKSFYDTGVDVVKDDNILILQTCSNNPDYIKYPKKYLIIAAKKVI